MGTQHVFSRFIRAAWRKAAADERGAIAPLAAVLLGTLLVGAGVGMDVSRVAGVRGELQDATDAAGLALGRMPPASDLDSVLKPAGQAWVKANLHGATLNPNAVTVNVTKSLGVVTISASTAVQPTLAAMIHLGPFQVQAASTIKYGLSHVELALVLDNTGSMADDNKLDSLKSAAGTLVDTLSASAQASGDANALKVGVVPFSISVNIGSTYQGQPWLTGIQPSAYGQDLFTTSNTDRFALLRAMNTGWGGCVESRPMPYDVQDDSPLAGNPATLFVPFFAPDESDDGGYSGSTYAGYANSYLRDVTGDTQFVDKQGDVRKYVSRPATSAVAYGSVQYGPNALSPYAVGPNSGCGTAAMLPLTTDMGAVKTELTQMVANGNTHIPLGMAWGWNLLSPNMPFGAQPYGTKNLLKIAVLVTDGANTYAQSGAPGSSTYANVKICKNGSGLYYCPGTSGSPADDNSNYTGYGYSWQKRIKTDAGSYGDPVTAMNNRLTKLCANMKSAGITVYTVPVEVTDTSIKTLLQGCASGRDKYIDVSSSAGLAAAFNNIAGSIGSLRVSH